MFDQECFFDYRNQDGALTLSEFENVVRHVSRRFPLTKQHLGKLVEMFETYDKDHNGLLDMDEMRTLLHDIDSKMTNLPAVRKKVDDDDDDGFNARYLIVLLIDGSSGSAARCLLGCFLEQISQR